jgi:hypothetical protein
MWWDTLFLFFSDILQLCLPTHVVYVIIDETAGVVNTTTIAQLIIDKLVKGVSIDL